MQRKCALNLCHPCCLPLPPLVVILAAAFAFVCVARAGHNERKRTKIADEQRRAKRADLTIEHNIPAQTQIPTNVGQKLLRAHMGQLTLLTVEWTEWTGWTSWTSWTLDIPDSWTRGQPWWLECWPWPVGHVPWTKVISASQ